MTTHGGIRKEILEVVKDITSRGDILNPDDLARVCRERNVPLDIRSFSLIFQGHKYGGRWLPTNVVQLFTDILKPYCPKSVLDPWAGSGFLSIPLSQELKPDRFKAYSKMYFEKEEVYFDHKTIWNTV